MQTREQDRKNLAAAQRDNEIGYWIERGLLGLAALAGWLLIRLLFR